MLPEKFDRKGDQGCVYRLTEISLGRWARPKYFQHLQKKYLPHREPDLSLFNANEIKVIDDVLQKLSGMNASTISEYSHQDVPWVVTPDRQKIDYESVFYRTPAYSVREYCNDDVQTH